jgi:hypothetical protein
VRSGSRTETSVPLVLPQNRHPACPACRGTGAQHSGRTWFPSVHPIWLILIMVTTLNFVIPSTRISYFTALPAATYAALRKESRMKSLEATLFDRKSGAGEGPAVRPGSHTKLSVPLVLPQNRHPACLACPGPPWSLPWERSASRADCFDYGSPCGSVRRQ